ATLLYSSEGKVRLANVTVTDRLIQIVTGSRGAPDGEGQLGGAQTWAYTGTYTITQDDIDAGQVTNQATATGTAPDQSTVSDLSDESSVLEDDPTVIELCQNPAIALIKTGVVNDTNGNGCADVDETISYSFTVVNLGNVTLFNVSVTDPMVAVNGGPITLAPNASDATSFTATYTITQSDIDAGLVENQATATGTDASGTTVSDLSDDNSELEDDPTITIVCQNPAIAIVKTGVFNDANQNHCADVDETISYTFTVTNQDNVSLGNVTVTDPLIATITGPTGDTDGDGELDVTETWTYTVTYTITQDDIDNGEVVNQATATGNAPHQSTVSDLSDESSVLEND